MTWLVAFEATHLYDRKGGDSADGLHDLGHFEHHLAALADTNTSTLRAEARQTNII